MSRMRVLQGKFDVRRRQTGVAMVEFAIGLSILLILLVGVVEFGRMSAAYNILLQSTRDAARYAAHHAWNSTTGKVEVEQVRSVSEKLAVYGSPEGGGDPLLSNFYESSGTFEISVSDTGDHIKVTMRYTFDPLNANSMPIFLGGAIPLSVVLVSTTVMRVL